MSETRSRKKRDISPPIRNWPPLKRDDESAADSDEAAKFSRLLPVEERGLAGADDIVRWLAVIMNEKGVTFDKLSKRSGVPVRTIKNWSDHDQSKRKLPNLRSIQACLEALGQSLIPAKAEIVLNNGEYFYPIRRFRQELLERWLEQAARLSGLSVDEFIEKSEADYHEAVKRGRVGPRRRDT